MPPRRRPPRDADPLPATLRIIGGTYGGRKLLYSGDLRTRPMKERVREAIFNLISTDSKGRYALDLFAGTGALGLEALSRGAVGATFIERHFPTAEIIRRNCAALGVEGICHVEAANTFVWPDGSWISLPTARRWSYFARRRMIFTLIGWTTCCD